ncbi:hypothetical protein [Pullulanibacillus camelliae]|nr:hypothetical protein [Pullulanibacillus camelliae]
MISLGVPIPIRVSVYGRCFLKRYLVEMAVDRLIGNVVYDHIEESLY